MVFFTCNHCGESLKKQAVEKHYTWQRCKGVPVFVTCVDCMKDFRDQEYVAHTKCISEAERYYGKDYHAKPSQNKGQKKQEAWTDIIQTVLQRDDLTTRLRGVLQQLTKHENVPRKKAKFLNFMKNVSKQTSEYDATRIFDLIEEAFNATKTSGQNGGDQTNGVGQKRQNGVTEDQEPKKKKQKVEKNSAAEEVSLPEDSSVIPENTSISLKKTKKKKEKKNEENPCPEELPEAPITSEEQLDSVPKKSKKKNIQENGNYTVGILPEEELVAEKPKKKSKKQENGHPEENGVPEEEGDSVTSKKKATGNENSLKSRQEVIKEVKESANESESFPWKLEITKILQKNENTMDLVKLQKRIIKKYKKAHPESEIIDNTIDLLLSRKLRKMKNVICDDNRVTIKA
ncbi:Cell growth-regulating nucleolar protein [Sergentomyia squamirostris]